ncbi:MAG TPA: oxidoreductase [Planctomycetaceae bacterium]|nr:oxidoreductase [Planctomycetaceae bacterium]
MDAELFRCYLVDKDPQGNVRAELTRRPLDELPGGDVLIRVDYSSLNYKDALAVRGHPGVVKRLPMVVGVDAAGTVVESGVYEFVEGDPVLVNGFDLGVTHWGGWAQYVRVPQQWVVPMPPGLTPKESMMLGTAGLTAALCVRALQEHDVKPGSGPVVVTGASGGVGSVAVALLSQLGYDVVAVTGKPAARNYLQQLGARQVVPRQAVTDTGGKPLLSRQWAGAVDTVGGDILSTLLRSTRPFGCVAACGNAADARLPITVYPFILRGITLAGVDAAMCPMPVRHELWQKLAGPWKPKHLAQIARSVQLDEVQQHAEQILAGQLRGRLVVRVAGEDQPQKGHEAG